jgi:lipoate-protein ligase B
MRIKFFELGLVEFAKAYSLQKELRERVGQDEYEHAALICRHYPVITLGRPADKENILAGENELAAKGIKVFSLERGGDVTYHGPGQLMVYPVFNLGLLKRDLHWFLRLLEEAIISCLSGFGIAAARRDGLTGVWVGEKKIASIGIAVKNWVSWHGLSLNVKKGDLDNFKLIRPCGMDIEMTAMEEVARKEVDMEVVARTMQRLLEQAVSPRRSGAPVSWR